MVSPLERGYPDSGDEGEDGGNEQPTVHGVAQAVDVLVPSPLQGDDVNVQMSEEDNTWTDVHDSPKKISKEDKEYL